MRTCDLDTDAARIRDALDELRIAWEEVGEYWNDDVSRAFCERRLEPMGPVFKSGLDSLSHMAQLVGQMHRECSDEPPDAL